MLTTKMAKITSLENLYKYGNYLRVTYVHNAKFIVTAQEGPGIVIAHPGQDVELLCTVTESSTSQTTGWLVNNEGPYRISAIRSGILTGHTATLDSSNLTVENIMMNDGRNGSEYICVVIPAQGMVTFADIIDESDPTILYVAGEYLPLYITHLVFNMNHCILTKLHKNISKFFITYVCMYMPIATQHEITGLMYTKYTYSYSTYYLLCCLVFYRSINCMRFPMKSCINDVTSIICYKVIQKSD